ncbi:hypothetical protein ABZ921_10240 [Streptomyces atriruber]|uniref:Secreted protein n=1 Tax=Streptomyces atriruber TaxID=545121 RepID=A0ABV3BJ39_9ACTN
MTSRDSLRTAVALVAVAAVLLAAVTTAAPETAHFLCGLLLGASVTAVAFALAGWGVVCRCTGGRDFRGDLSGDLSGDFRGDF